MRIENNYSPLQISGKNIVELRRVRSQLDGGPGLMNHRRGQDRNVRERQGGCALIAVLFFFFSLSLPEGQPMDGANGDYGVRWED